MHYSKLMMVGLVAPALVLSACNRRPESREPAARNEATQTADEAAKRQQERADDISRLDKRVAEIEREYQKANEKVVADKKTPTEGLKAELKEDVINVKEAVNDLRTTTPENWWNRHEEAMRRTADDVEADVARLAWTGEAGGAKDNRERPRRYREHGSVHLTARRVRRGDGCAGRCHEAGTRQGQGEWPEADGSRRRARPH
jgi:hypothetical protein